MSEPTEPPADLEYKSVPGAMRYNETDDSIGEPHTVPAADTVDQGGPVGRVNQTTEQDEADKADPDTTS